jgi:predicted membrane channel-forming protein YqfA (hemolysin III family)
MSKDSIGDVRKYYRKLTKPSLTSRFFDFLKAIPLLRGISASPRACWYTLDREPQNGAPIFVAVHGTWNKRAAWAKPDSNLFKGLSEFWPQSGLCRFVWSATNGIRHRLVAADVLSEVFKDLQRTYPSSPIVAIAHSHGGNVVAWASTRIRTPLAAAVYLNTPFIQALPSSSTFNLLLRIVLAVVGLIVFLPLARTVQDLFDERPDLDATRFFVGLAVFGLGMISVQIIVPRWVKSNRDKLVEASNGARQSSRELAAFVVGDEPSSAFGAVYFLQWMWQKVFFALLWLIFVLGAALSHYFPVIGTRMEQLFPYLLGAIVTLYVAYLILAVAAYGLIQALIALDAPVAATPSPQGTADSLTIAWTHRDWLRHSLVHDSPEAIEPIAGWLKDLLGNHSPKGTSEV